MNPFQDRVSIWSIHWIHIEHFYDQFFQFIRVTLSDFFIGSLKDSSLIWFLLIILERMSQSTKIVENASQGPDISLGIIRLIEESFRCLIADIPLIRECRGLSLLSHLFRDSKISQLEDSLVHKDISWCQVSVDYSS